MLSFLTIARYGGAPQWLNTVDFQKILCLVPGNYALGTCASWNYRWHPPKAGLGTCERTMKVEALLRN